MEFYVKHLHRAINWAQLHKEHQFICHHIIYPINEFMTITQKVDKVQLNHLNSQVHNLVLLVHRIKFVHRAHIQSINPLS